VKLVFDKLEPGPLCTLRSVQSSGIGMQLGAWGHGDNELAKTRVELSAYTAGSSLILVMNKL